MLYETNCCRIITSLKHLMQLTYIFSRSLNGRKNVPKIAHHTMDRIEELDPPVVVALKRHQSACTIAHIEEARANGGHILEESNHFKFTPFHLAIAKGCSLDVIHYLIENGADPFHKSSYGKSSLHFAAGWGNAEGVEFLLKLGLKVNDQDFGNWTPLLDFANQKEAADGIRTAQLLLQAGADTEIINRWEQKACEIATSRAEKLSAEQVSLLTMDMRFIVMLCFPRTCQNRRSVSPLRILPIEVIRSIIHAAGYKN